MDELCLRDRAEAAAAQTAASVAMQQALAAKTEEVALAWPKVTPKGYRHLKRHPPLALVKHRDHDPTS